MTDKRHKRLIVFAPLMLIVLAGYAAYLGVQYFRLPRKVPADFTLYASLAAR